MKIMEIVSGTAVNGAVVTCLETARALKARGHEVTVVCRPRSWIAEQLVNDEIPIVVSDLRRWPFDQLRRVAQIAKERQIDVIHTHMSSASFFGVLLRAFSRIPCVATAHNRYIQLHWMFNDCVVAVSEATRRFHHRYNFVRKRRIEVVHNFVNYQRFESTSSGLSAALRAELGVPAAGRLIGIIGDVIARKGMLYLVRALPAIVAAIPDVHVLCVGYLKPEYADKVRAESQRLGVADRITWAGPRGDIDQILRTLDLYVLPSLEENLPLSILEAMASRRAVVASAVGGIPECVIHEQTGLLVPPAQPEPLAAAIIRALSDPQLRAQWGEAGAARVRSEFSLDAHVSQMERIFRRLAA